MLKTIEQQPPHEPAAASFAGWTQLLRRLPLRPKEWLGVFEGHEIRVLTRGPLLARLRVDGKLLDRRSPLLCLDRKVPLLSGRLPNTGPDVTIAYVYTRGLFSIQIEVRVAGKMIPMSPCVDAQNA